ncbi:MAG TPA: hypothetical protein VFF40_13200 [Acidimicrobiia bacterium]|nr:hypothetical protein [Acidimicrobiia bacterium]
MGGTDAMGFNRKSLKVGGRVAGFVVLALMLSGCFRPLAVTHQQDSPSTRPFWCESTGGEGTHGSAYYTNLGIQKGMLSWEDCLELSGNLDDALAYAMQWPTRGAAEADGWNAQVNYATGMGTHHALGNPLQGSFDPGRPNFLQYDGNGPDAKLVGMSWYVNNGPAGPPAGFPGDNDWWHTHEYLCIANGSGLVIRDGQCLAGQDGVSVYLGDFWMVHAWIVPGWFHQSDIFVGHHPCLLPGGPADAGDPCWTMGHMG